MANVVPVDVVVGGIRARALTRNNASRTRRISRARREIVKSAVGRSTKLHEWGHHGDPTISSAPLPAGCSSYEPRLNEDPSLKMPDEKAA